MLQKISLYHSKQAHHRATKRKSNCGNKFYIQGNCKLYVDEKLTQKWSPDQISHRSKMEGEIHISHETIYQYVYNYHVSQRC